MNYSDCMFDNCKHNTSAFGNTKTRLPSGEGLRAGIDAMHDFMYAVDDKCCHNGQDIDLSIRDIIPKSYFDGICCSKEDCCKSSSVKMESVTGWDDLF